VTDAGRAHPPSQTGEQIEIVLFDIGGVLARFSGISVLRELTGAASETEVARRWLMSPSVRRFESGACTDHEFAAGMVAEWELPYSAEEFLAIFPTWLEDPFDGAEQMIRDASARVGVGCLSNTNSLQWRGTISQWPLSRYFEYRFLSFELGAVKPDPEIYELAIARLPAPPENVLFLDDNPPNVAHAQAIGLRAEQVGGVAQARAVLERYGVLA